jgi:hypothetical protein
MYLSDFVGPNGLPAEFCRPSKAEIDSGVSRYVILSFGEKYKI